MAKKEVIQIRCSAQEKDKWKDAAASVGLELSAWIRITLDRALRPREAPTVINAPETFLDSVSQIEVGEHKPGKISKPQQ